MSGCSFLGGARQAPEVLPSPGLVAPLPLAIGSAPSRSAAVSAGAAEGALITRDISPGRQQLRKRCRWCMSRATAVQAHLRYDSTGSAGLRRGSSDEGSREREQQEGEGEAAL